MKQKTLAKIDANSEEDDTKPKVDAEQSSDYSESLVGQSTLIDQFRDKFQYSTRLLRDSDFRPNRSLLQHSIHMDKEKEEWLLEEAARLYKLEQYELPSEKYINKHK